MLRAAGGAGATGLARRPVPAQSSAPRGMARVGVGRCSVPLMPCRPARRQPAVCAPSSGESWSPPPGLLRRAAAASALALGLGLFLPYSAHAAPRARLPPPPSTPAGATPSSAGRGAGAGGGAPAEAEMRPRPREAADHPAAALLPPAKRPASRLPQGYGFEGVHWAFGFWNGPQPEGWPHPVLEEGAQAVEGSSAEPAARKPTDLAAAARDFRTCGLPSCGKREVTVRHFKLCTGCNAVAYCCDEHHDAHWREGHRRECRHLRAAGAKPRSTTNAKPPSTANAA